MVYKDGKKVKGINQAVGDDDYGEASMVLPEGVYQVLVLAHSSSSNPTLTAPEKIQFTNAMGYTDTFLFYGDIEVTEENSTHNIQLERVTAMLRFVMEDDMPQGVKSVKFYYTGGSGALNANTGMGCVDSKQTVTIDVNPQDGKPYTFEVYTIPKDASASLNLTVTALDANSETVAEKIIKGVPIERNKITVLSGEFFNGDNPGENQGTGEDDPSLSENAFVIMANTEWGGVINRTY